MAKKAKDKTKGKAGKGARKGGKQALTAREAIARKGKDVSRKQARKSIHPEYVECRITCGCGNVVMTRAAVPEIQVGVCSNCHPFYTGTQKFVDSAGRVEKFQQRYKWTAEEHLEKQPEGKSKKVKKSRK